MLETVSLPLSLLKLTMPWRTEGATLLIGADLALKTDFSPTFSVTKTSLTLTFEEPQQNGVRREVRKYSRVTS